MKTDRKPGRPKGAKTQRLPVVDEVPAACTKCGSTERLRGKCIRVQEGGGLYAGKPYDRVVWRKTTCAACGQGLTVREYHRQAAEEI